MNTAVNLTTRNMRAPNGLSLAIIDSRGMDISLVGKEQIQPEVKKLVQYADIICQRIFKKTVGESAKFLQCGINLGIFEEAATGPIPLHLPQLVAYGSTAISHFKVKNNLGFFLVKETTSRSMPEFRRDILVHARASYLVNTESIMDIFPFPLPNRERVLLVLPLNHTKHAENWEDHPVDLTH